MYGSKDSKSRRTSKLHDRFKSYEDFRKVFCQRVGTSRWRVCYQRGLPRLVSADVDLQPLIGLTASWTLPALALLVAIFIEISCRVVRLGLHLNRFNFGHPSTYFYSPII